MTERKHDRPPDEGSSHAVLIALFNGRKAGRVVTMAELKTAIADEYGDKHNIISGNVVRAAIFRLRKDFKELAPDFKIRNRKNVGYYIEKDTDSIRGSA